MSENKSIEERIIKCLKNVRTIQKPITPDTLFKDDLGFESIDVVDLLFELDQEFSKSFPMKEFNHFVLTTSQQKNWDFTLSQICQFVSKQIGT